MEAQLVVHSLHAKSSSHVSYKYTEFIKYAKEQCICWEENEHKLFYAKLVLPQTWWDKIFVFEILPYCVTMVHYC